MTKEDLMAAHALRRRGGARARLHHAVSHAAAEADRQPAGRRTPLLGHLDGAEDVARDPAVHGDGRGRRAWPRRWRSMPACSVRDVDVKRAAGQAARAGRRPRRPVRAERRRAGDRAPGRSAGRPHERDDDRDRGRPAARRHPRHRLHAGDDGPGVHADARRLRRRRDQDRARRRRRPEPLDLPAERRHRQPGLLQPEPQQAQRRARPAQRRAAWRR